jgi:hypothetical protein
MLLTIYTLNLIVFSILAYIIFADKNVEDYLILLLKIARLNVERFFWIVKYHPKNFITNYLKYREFQELSKKMELEFLNRDND